MKKLLSILIITILCVPLFTSAQETDYKLLEPLPGVTTNGTSATAKSYIEGAVQLVIALAAALAVIRIIIGGFQYITSDAMGKKSDAKKTINGALWGLFLAMTAFLILYTVNPDLVQLNLSLERFSSDALNESINNPDNVGSGEGSLGTYNTSGCKNCVKTDIYQFPQKNVAEKGCASPGPCIINQELAEKLERMHTDRLSILWCGGDPKCPRGSMWKVTEMFPPHSQNHAHACHHQDTSVSGMCVDASLNVACANTAQCSSANLKEDADKINKFLSASQMPGVNLRAIYEVSYAKRKDDLIRAGVPGNSIILVDKLVDGSILREHFSVYLNEQVHQAKN